MNKQSVIQTHANPRQMHGVLIPPSSTIQYHDLAFFLVFSYPCVNYVFMGCVYNVVKSGFRWKTAMSYNQYCQRMEGVAIVHNQEQPKCRPKQTMKKKENKASKLGQQRNSSEHACASFLPFPKLGPLPPYGIGSWGLNTVWAGTFGFFSTSRFVPEGHPQK